MNLLSASFLCCFFILLGTIAASHVRQSPLRPAFGTLSPRTPLRLQSPHGSIVNSPLTPSPLRLREPRPSIQGHEGASRIIFPEMPDAMHPADAVDPMHVVDEVTEPELCYMCMEQLHDHSVVTPGGCDHVVHYACLCIWSAR